MSSSSEARPMTHRKLVGWYAAVLLAFTGGIGWALDQALHCRFASDRAGFVALTAIGVVLVVATIALLVVALRQRATPRPARAALGGFVSDQLLQRLPEPLTVDLDTSGAEAADPYREEPEGPRLVLGFRPWLWRAAVPGLLMFAGPFTALTLIVAVYGWFTGRDTLEALGVSTFPVAGIAMLASIVAQVRRRVAVDLRATELVVITRTLLRQRTKACRRGDIRSATVTRTTTRPNGSDPSWTVTLSLADGESLVVLERAKLCGVAVALRDVVAAWAECE